MAKNSIPLIVNAVLIEDFYSFIWSINIPYLLKLH